MQVQIRGLLSLSELNLGNVFLTGPNSGGWYDDSEWCPSR